MLRMGGLRVPMARKPLLRGDSVACIPKLEQGCATACTEPASLSSFRPLPGTLGRFALPVYAR